MELRSSVTHPIIIVAAAQDRLWWRLPRTLTSHFAEEVFEGLEDSDAEALADRWASLGLLPEGDQGQLQSVGSVANELKRASKARDKRRGSSLLGAILEVREARTLESRIENLMEHLKQTRVSGNGEVTLADMFGAICLLEVTHSSVVHENGGASRVLISELVNSEDVGANDLVLRALGREAAVTFAGRKVLSRHPMIAAAGVRWLKKSGRLAGVAGLIGEAGGRLRARNDLLREDYANAYRLGKNLEDRRAALAAAQGAIRGAKDLLEPRITYLSIVRALNPSKAHIYAYGIVPMLSSSSDKRSAIRVFLNELSQVASIEHEYQRALGLACLSLHDGSGYPAERDMVGYAFGSAATALSYLVRQDARRFGEICELLEMLNVEILGEAHYRQYVGPKLRGLVKGADRNRPSFHVALERFAQLVDPYVNQAITDLRLPFAKVGGAGFQMGFRIELGELEQLRQR
jgi:hypothetical protein